MKTLEASPGIRRLAVVYPKAIGDFVFLLPALHTIRRALPDARLTLIVKRKQAPLAVPQRGALADEVWTLGGDGGWFAIRRRLSDLAPDVIIDMAGNDQSGLLLACRRGRLLRPHPADCKGRAALYTPFAESLPRLPSGLHRVDELLTYARHLTGAPPIVSFRLALPEAAVEACGTMIDRHRLRDGSVIALNVGASRATKRWPADRFRELAQALIARGHRVVITGARECPSDGHYDRGVAAAFAGGNPVDNDRCVDLIADGELPAALQMQRDAHFLRYSGIPRVVVGNDTGPMHLAGSVGDDARNRTVSIFGPTNWGRYAPYDPTRRYPVRPAGDWNRVVFADLACRPPGAAEACRYYRRGCPDGIACMADLPLDAVLGAVLERLEPT